MQMLQKKFCEGDPFLYINIFFFYILWNSFTLFIFFVENRGHFVSYFFILSMLIYRKILSTARRNYIQFWYKKILQNKNANWHPSVKLYNRNFRINSHHCWWSLQSGSLPRDLGLVQILDICKPCSYSYFRFSIYCMYSYTL